MPWISRWIRAKTSGFLDNGKRDTDTARSHVAIFRSPVSEIVTMRLAYLYSRYPVHLANFLRHGDAGAGTSRLLSRDRFDSSAAHEHATRACGEIEGAHLLCAAPADFPRPREKTRRPRIDGRQSSSSGMSKNTADGVKAATTRSKRTYFADLFTRNKVEHFHVHFANRAAHTALFLKRWGHPIQHHRAWPGFHGRSGQRRTPRRNLREAEFVAAETDYSVSCCRQRCPGSRGQNPSRI